MFWRIRDPERRKAAKAEFERLHPIHRQQKGRNNNLRREGDSWIKHHYAHPYSNPLQERWAKAAAQTDARPINPLYYELQLEGDKLVIVVVETCIKYPVPEDAPGLMRALINHLHQTTKR